MKRILALIMVLAMVFAFAACKSKDDGATTTDPSSAGGEVIDNGEGSTPKFPPTLPASPSRLPRRQQAARAALMAAKPPQPLRLLLR